MSEFVKKCRAIELLMDIKEGLKDSDEFICEYGSDLEAFEEARRYFDYFGFQFISDMICHLRHSARIWKV